MKKLERLNTDLLYIAQFINWVESHTDSTKEPNLDEYTGGKPNCLYHLAYDYEWANWTIYLFEPIK